MNKDWIEVEFNKIIDFALGGDWGKDISFSDPDYKETYCIRGSEFRNWAEDKGKTASLRKLKSQSIEKRKLLVDDILVEISGGGPEQPVGRTVVIDKATLSHFQNFNVVCTNFLRLIRTYETINSKWVNTYLEYFYRAGKTIPLQAGSNNLRNLKFPDFISIRIPLAPLPEQRAIVAKIEQLFSELDNGIANLKTAQQKLTLYKQAVLKKAFEGGFTEDEPRKLSTVCKKVQIGPFGSQLHREDYIVDGVPLINPMHIQDGKVEPNNTYTISQEKKESLPNYVMQTGDVIMGRRGEMGRCALITDKENGWFCGTGSLYLRPDSEKVNSTYLNLYLGSQVIKRLLSEQAAGTTMMNLNKKIIQNLPFPSHTLSEQNQIVQEIESRLSVCDKVQETIIQNLTKAEALRQSILKKAFSGKLLTEKELTACRKEADYAPASELLKSLIK